MVPLAPFRCRCVQVYSAPQAGVIERVSLRHLLTRRTRVHVLVRALCHCTDPSMAARWACARCHSEAAAAVRVRSEAGGWWLTSTDNNNNNFTLSGGSSWPITATLTRRPWQCSLTTALATLWSHCHTDKEQIEDNWRKYWKRTHIAGNLQAYSLKCQ